MKDGIIKHKYKLLSLVLGILIIPFGYWTELGRGFVFFTNSLIGLSAAFTAWWAYDTFAYKERINEYKSIYAGLKNAEAVYIKRYGAHYNLINTLISANAHNPDIRAEYIEQLSSIEREHKIAEDFLNDLFFSPFVTDNFNIRLMLLIRVKDFSCSGDVQKAFFEIKSLHRKEFIIKR